MKNRLSLFALASLSLIIGLGMIYQQSHSPSPKYTPRDQNVGSKIESSIQGAQEYIASIRGDVQTGEVDPKLYDQALSRAKHQVAMRGGALDLNFAPMGPSNIGGRSRALVIDNKNSDRLYLGSVTGGIFISTNGGNSWTSNFDNQGWLHISSMTQANDGTLFASTGSQFEILGTIPLKGGTPSGRGEGIYISEDRGVSWKIIPSTDPNTNPAFWSVNEIASHPTQSDLVVAATEKGLLLSTDKGNTWTDKILCNGGGTPILAPIYSIEFSKDGKALYVGLSNGALFYSDDYLNDCSFKQVTQISVNRFSRMTLSASPTHSAGVYACYADSSDKPTLFQSLDYGKSWKVFNPPMPSSVSHFDIFGGNPKTYNQLFTAVKNPQDPNEDMLFVGAVQLWRYDGNWTMAATSGRFTNEHEGTYVHADHHFCLQDPTNPSTIYFLNDGGIHKSLDGGYEFFDINKGYQTTQFYSIQAANFDYVVGGTQDNGCISLSPYQTGNPDYGKITYNEGVLNGDGFDCAVSSIVDLKFTTAQQGNLGRGKINSSQGSGWCEPYCGLSGFYTYTAFYENENDASSKDSIEFTVALEEDNFALGSGTQTTFKGTITLNRHLPRSIIPPLALELPPTD
ncbi:hypothetical protein KFE98_10960 [bacterium SCSIO 12741]|nr:hypothetical protein KFE98_10960 [bacterium SCSIO 12741]